MLESAKSAYDEFQSTRPVRGATGRWSAKELPIWISIHAPRAGRDVQTLPTLYFRHPISIHAPRAGRDKDNLLAETAELISIHAPRAGRDFAGLSLCFILRYFNPRAPCGARPQRQVQTC